MSGNGGLSRELLIRDASLLDGQAADIRIAQGKIIEIGRDLAGAEPAVEAAGGLLLPGLHDHHIHIAATAAGFASVRCGPPEVENEQALANSLGQPGEGWLRGIGYHENVTGRLIDRRWLDGVNSKRPLRVQHRSGRMWIFNSVGLALLLGTGIAAPPGLERETGRLFDDDGFLRRALGGVPPNFAQVGAMLARRGVTGVTDMSPGNDDAIAAHFAQAQDSGALPQRAILAGRLELGGSGLPAGLRLGPFKLHLHEAQLPDFDGTVAAIRTAHAQNRPVAVHCVTEVELVFTLAALAEAGPHPGDRIEHASVTPAALLEEIAAQDLIVVAQPHFVAERGDAYRAAIVQAEWPDLYRLQSFGSAGVTLAGGSDAPFGAADPWAAMQAAVTRRTAHGQVLGLQEALTPEAALALFLADPAELRRTRQVQIGASADLCLLSQPWHRVREDLSGACVRASFIGGRLFADGVDQAQVQRGLGADALAR